MSNVAKNALGNVTRNPSNKPIGRNCSDCQTPDQRYLFSSPLKEYDRPIPAILVDGLKEIVRLLVCESFVEHGERSTYSYFCPQFVYLRKLGEHRSYLILRQPDSVVGPSRYPASHPFS